MENLSAACRKAEPCGSPPRFQTMRRMPAACPRFPSCAVSYMLVCSPFLPALFRLYFAFCSFLFVFLQLYFPFCIFLSALLCLHFSARSLRPLFSTRSFPSTLSRLYFPNCSFLSCLFLPALSFPLFPARSFLPALSCLRFPVHTVSFCNRSILTFPTVSVFHTHRNALRLLPAFFQTVPSSFQAHFPLRFSRFQKNAPPCVVRHRSGACVMRLSVGRKNGLFFAESKQKKGIGPKAK